MLRWKVGMNLAEGGCGLILIVGGRYQGKLDYATDRFHLSSEDIFICSDRSPALEEGKRCIAYIDRWVLGQVREGRSCVDFPLSMGADRIVLSTDISCGVVPTDPVLRAWREACGRLNTALAREADEVWRLFCGIAQRLK